MSEKYPHPPPADAREWACPVCACDVLFCGCLDARVRPDSLLGFMWPLFKETREAKKQRRAMTLTEEIPHG